MSREQLDLRTRSLRHLPRQGCGQPAALPEMQRHRNDGQPPD